MSVFRFPANTTALAIGAALFLGGAALVQVGYHVAIAAETNDVGPFETVLAHAVAAHFDSSAGASRFYGPYDGEHPSVLMHAPLYYRLVAGLAWPAVRMGADPDLSVLYAGRALSALSTLLLVWSVATWARIGRAGVRSAVFASSLLLASPIFGNLMAMVRPDTFGVALQTTAGLLIARLLARTPTSQGSAQTASTPGQRAPLALACALFALAFAAKQHNVFVAFLCALLLVNAVRTRVVSTRTLAIAGGVGASIAIAYLAAENLWTGGRLWKTVFVYPSGPFRAINYAGWVHVVSIFNIVTRRSLGLIALGAIAACILGRRCLSDRVDRTLFALLALELCSLVPLSLFNAGAASNYALQAVVFACILVGRAWDRIASIFAQLTARTRAVAAVGAFASCFLIAASDARWVAQTADLRRAEHTAVAAILSDDTNSTPNSESRYFVARQHLNRLFGNDALIHDDWLYGAFETASDAEPRNAWLLSALSTGPVTQVVVEGDSERVPGIDLALPEIGYTRYERHGELTVWNRTDRDEKP